MLRYNVYWIADLYMNIVWPITFAKFTKKNLASEDTTLPILWVGGAYTTKIMPPKLS